MKGNYVAKHMNTVNRSSVHSDQKKEARNNWSEHDLEEFNLSIMKHFNTLSEEEKEEFLHGRFVPLAKEELDEDQLKYLTKPKNRVSTSEFHTSEGRGYLGESDD